MSVPANRRYTTPWWPWQAFLARVSACMPIVPAPRISVLTRFEDVESFNVEDEVRESTERYQRLPH